MPAQPSTWPCNCPVLGHAHLAVAALSQQAQVCWTFTLGQGFRAQSLGLRWRAGRGAMSWE